MVDRTGSGFGIGLNESGNRNSFDMLDDIREILRNTLQLGDRADLLTAESPLLGAVPEFDSMAVVTVLTMVEEEFGIEIEDDDVSAEVFETVGALAAFVEARVNR